MPLISYAYRGMKTIDKLAPGAKKPYVPRLREAMNQSDA